MSSGAANKQPHVQTAAWRISLWGGIAFAIGTAIAFWFLQAFLVHEIQKRADAWLTGELGVLVDVAENTPNDKRHEAVISEVADLASREVPHLEGASGALRESVFFLETDAAHNLVLETGAGRGADNLAAIQGVGRELVSPTDIKVTGFDVPFRVAYSRLNSGERVYLGLSSAYQRQVLLRLRLECFAFWCAIIVLGTGIVFVSTRSMLLRVRAISEAASQIGRSNLKTRVGTGEGNDEIAQLSVTFNQMLDRIEWSVQQLHTLSDSLAHDLRSPMTSMRGKLELALMSEETSAKEEALISAIEEIDRLSALFSTSLDVSEASADALRLRRERHNLELTVRSLVELYEPSFSESGLTLSLQTTGPVWIEGDPSLIQRTVSNLLDNSLKHTRPGTIVVVSVQHTDKAVLRVEDNGDGFPEELLPRLFQRHAKGPYSTGHGLGLAFVAAVVRSHNGEVNACNLPGGGASISIEFPTASTEL
jgi:signal transduction histidine kinase